MCFIGPGIYAEVICKQFTCRVCLKNIDFFWFYIIIGKTWREKRVTSMLWWDFLSNFDKTKCILLVKECMLKLSTHCHFLALVRQFTENEWGKQARAELCQAQVKLGLAKIEIFFHFIESLGRLPLKKNYCDRIRFKTKLRLSSIFLYKNWGFLPLAK